MSKRKLLLVSSLVFVLLLFMFGLSYSFFAAPTAKITVVNGIPNIGKGASITLQANEGDTDILSYTWALDTVPTNSAAVLTSADKDTTGFIADSSGTYKVTLVVTDAGGTSDPVELYVNAGTYVGVGTIGGATPDFTTGQCGLCHGDHETGWEGTLHGEALSVNLDDPAGHFSENCLSCHTTGYGDGDNGGFDDLADEYGWTFPAELKAGNFVTNFPEVAVMAEVQCEACHGPGSAHKANTTNNRIYANIGEEEQAHNCETCHSGQDYRLQQSVHWVATSYPTGDNREDCVKCHSGKGFIFEYDDQWADHKPVICRSHARPVTILIRARTNTSSAGLPPSSSAMKRFPISI
ncbi:cytochrome c3 family protein [candidate division KSB1 bacterium]